ASSFLLVLRPPPAAPHLGYERRAPDSTHRRQDSCRRSGRSRRRTDVDLVDALDRDHPQASGAVAERLGLPVDLCVVPVAGGGEILELEHDQTGRLPVAFEDGQLTAPGQEAAATGLGGGPARHLLSLL